MRLNSSLILCSVALLTCGCEQRLSRDAEGFPHGTGEFVYKYTSGALKQRDAYKNGQSVYSRWYKPDGMLIQETYWQNGDGEGVYLREDGSIKQRMTYVHGIAEGESTKYDKAGRASRVM